MKGDQLLLLCCWRKYKLVHLFRKTDRKHQLEQHICQPCDPEISLQDIYLTKMHMLFTKSCLQKYLQHH